MALNEKATLELTREQRAVIWQKAHESWETYLSGVSRLPLAPSLAPDSVAGLLDEIDFTRAMSPEDALRFATRGLTEHTLHTSHPSYFGVFNPAPSTMGVLGETLAAAFNPQLASWTSAPFPIALEQRLIKELGMKFDLPASDIDGTFTSGGAEANHSALLCALTRHFPEYATKGARTLKGQPKLYVSSESHHSFLKAARLCGIGIDALREIPAGDDLKMDPAALERAIREDRARGEIPFFVVATAGTTSAGVIDPLPAIFDIAEREKLWGHLDAAWGGAAALVSELRPYLNGSGRADSITLDPHKWLSIPMGAGLFLSRHPGMLEETFHIDTSYMYRRGGKAGERTVDPYTRSMQWSRRFIGLKVFLSLAVAGWEGYAAVLRHQVSLGTQLKRGLAERDWRLANETPLPVACFRDDRAGASSVEEVAKRVAASGQSWVTTTKLRGEPVLRAGIANYKTSSRDIEALLDLLEKLR